MEQSIDGFVSPILLSITFLPGIFKISRVFSDIFSHVGKPMLNKFVTGFGLKVNQAQFNINLSGTQELGQSGT